MSNSNIVLQFKIAIFYLKTFLNM